MKIPARLIGALVATLFGATVAGHANADESALTIGVLTDLSSFAASRMGPGSVVATQRAVQDFGGTVLGKPIKVIAAVAKRLPQCEKMRIR